MGVIYVGIGEYATSKEPGAVVRTLALGSCVAVIALAPKHNCAGLVHIALPDSRVNLQRAEQRPGSFADTGIPVLLKAMQRHGIDPRRDLRIKLAGGASIMDDNNVFNIGKKNILAVRKTLWQYRLGAIAEHVGAKISRSVTVDINTLDVTISSPGRGEWKL